MTIEFKNSKLLNAKKARENNINRINTRVEEDKCEKKRKERVEINGKWR